MRIRRKKIRKLEPHLPFVPARATIVVGINDLNSRAKAMKSLGFSTDYSIGDTLLPPGIFGRVSEYNAEGKYKVRKDKPKETAYRQTEWHWREWRGRDDYEDMYRVVDVPYERYPREFVPPPSVELTIAGTPSERILMSQPITYDESNHELIKHIINLFLEIFGECIIYQENLEEFINIERKRLNWEILPPGKIPWSKLENKVDSIVSKAKEGNQAVIWWRFEMLHGYEPDFYAVGRAGFRGYIVFGFEDKNIYVVESIYTGNATYVFGEDWETLSQMTKAEILAGDLHEHRIIHRESWPYRIQELLS